MGLFRPSSQANLLRTQANVPALGTMETNGVNNPIGFYNPEKEKYRMIWRQYDLTQCLSRYVWENLPKGLTSWNLERMLYFRGSLCGFMFAGQFYILPYAITGQINPYGLPTAVKPITYNGKETPNEEQDSFSLDRLIVDNFGDNNRQDTCVLLYDSIPFSPAGVPTSRFFLNQIIINEMAETFARININIVVSNKKILLQVKDAKQADVIRKELRTAFGSDCPFGIITSPLETQTVQSSSDFNADELFNTIKNYDAIRCFMSGISSKNFGTEKKERLVSGELEGNEEQKDLVLDMGYDLRKAFADTVNRKFGLNITVRKRSDEYSDMVNGNGNTKLEEEEEL